MIASWRGIAVLAAIAVALAALLVFDVTRSHGPADRRLVHIDIAKVTELTWDGTHVVRSGNAWKQGDAILDSGAVADVLNTLASATWHRHGGRMQGAHHTLQVAGTTIQLGDELAGTAQTCLVVNGTRLLVDTWVANALFPEPLALRVRFPFAAAPRADYLHVRGAGVEVALAGHPRTFAEHAGIADVSAVHALEAALAESEAVGTGDAVWKGPFLVALGDSVTDVGYGADGQMTIYGPYGSESITVESWQRILDAAAAIEIDPHPLIAAPRSISLPDGTLDSHDSNAAALVHALVTPGTVVTSDARPLREIHVDGAEVDVLPGDLVRRMADSIVLHIAHADWLALQEPASAWADPTRWSEDPSAVSSIAVGAVTYHRGAVLGEWTPTSPLAAKDLEALAAALAHVQARDAAAAPTAHTLTVTLAPPVGPPVTHGLELGAHCTGRIDTTPVVFEPATCKALETALH